MAEFTGTPVYSVENTVEGVRSGNAFLSTNLDGTLLQYARIVGTDFSMEQVDLVSGANSVRGTIANLFGLNGASWPEIGGAAYVPGIDRWVVSEGDGGLSPLNLLNPDGTSEDTYGVNSLVNLAPQDNRLPGIGAAFYASVGATEYVLYVGYYGGFWLFQPDASNINFTEFNANTDLVFGSPTIFGAQSVDRLAALYRGDGVFTFLVNGKFGTANADRIQVLDVDISAGTIVVSNSTELSFSALANGDSQTNPGRIGLQQSPIAPGEVFYYVANQTPYLGKIAATGGSYAVTETVATGTANIVADINSPQYTPLDGLPDNRPFILSLADFQNFLVINPADQTETWLVDRTAVYGAVSIFGQHSVAQDANDTSRISYVGYEQLTGDLVVFSLDSVDFERLTFVSGTRIPRTPPPGIRLRFGNYTGVINSLGTFLQAELANYTDASSAGLRGGSLDVNGNRIRNVADGTDATDVVNYGQVKTALGI